VQRLSRTSEVTIFGWIVVSVGLGIAIIDCGRLKHCVGTRDYIRLSKLCEHHKLAREEVDKRLGLPHRVILRRSPLGSVALYRAPLCEAIVEYGSDGRTEKFWILPVFD